MPGILAFPLITLNGGTRSANVPLGNALKHFCGFNYQHGTLDKFFRELKYLGVSEDLLRDQVGFWQTSPANKFIIRRGYRKTKATS